MLSKDNEINKLTNENISKQNEINRLKKEVENLKKGSISQELEDNYKKEQETLNNKINNLNLKIYNLKDEKEKLEEKLKNSQNSGNNNNGTEELITLKEQNDEIRKNYEELIINKNELEEENKRLKKKLNTQKKKKKNKDKDNNEENENGNKNWDETENKSENKNDKNNENKNSNNENEDINYERELSDLKKLLYEYETGKIISDNTKKTIDLIKNDSLSQIEQLKERMDQLNIINTSKIKEYEINIFNANNEIKQKEKSISDCEKIILKQEDKIEELNKRITILNKEILNRELTMKKNENYSLQLMTIVNEQKLKIKTIKNKNIEQNNDEIIILKRQVQNLKNDIEIKENIIQTMKKYHKNLQDKYLNICYNVRKKEQEDLLRQAKILQRQKMERDYFSLKKDHPMNKSSSLSSIPVKKNKLNKKKCKQNNNIENRNLNKISSLPSINSDNKNDEGSKINNEGEIHESPNLNQINNMMKQIIEEN